MQDAGCRDILEICVYLLLQQQFQGLGNRCAIMPLSASLMRRTAADALRERKGKTNR